MVSLLTTSFISEAQSNFIHYVKHKPIVKSEVMLEVERQAKQARNDELTVIVITDYILDNNSKLTRETAKEYAETILYESRAHAIKVSPFVCASLLESESDFTSNPKHAISDVIGMGGVYSSVWFKDLKSKGFITCKDDLRNPYTNIKCSIYILAKYNAEKGNLMKALTFYKGFSKLGRSQAHSVMKGAYKVKSRLNTYA